MATAASSPAFNLCLACTRVGWKPLWSGGLGPIGSVVEGSGYLTSSGKPVAASSSASAWMRVIESLVGES